MAIRLFFRLMFALVLPTREVPERAPGVALIVSLVVVLVIILGVATPSAFADQEDPRLDELFSSLKKAEDPVAASLLELQIWDIWLENDNPDYYALMVSGIRHMNANALNLALDDFNRLIEIAPGYAEAWNKRATIYYLLKDFAASAKDIDKTLELEPFHFGALSGLGLVRLGEGRYLEARNAFQTVLEIYPAMYGVKQNLEQIENYLQNNSI